MTKQEIMAELEKRGIPFDAKATIPALKALIPTEPAPSKEDVVPSADSHEGIEVGDPLELRPVELPLVIKPSKGKEWVNKEQAEYAAYLNAYAYKNPTKWAKKKDVLIKRLVDIGTDPSKLNLLRGIDDNLTFKNKLIQPN